MGGSRDRGEARDSFIARKAHSSKRQQVLRILLLIKTLKQCCNVKNLKFSNEFIVGAMVQLRRRRRREAALPSHAVCDERSWGPHGQAVLTQNRASVRISTPTIQSPVGLQASRTTLSSGAWAIDLLSIFCAQQNVIQNPWPPRIQRKICGFWNDEIEFSHRQRRVVPLFEKNAERWRMGHAFHGRPQAQWKAAACHCRWG